MSIGLPAWTRPYFSSSSSGQLTSGGSGGGGLVLLLLPLALLLVGGQGLELQGVDAALAGHLVAQQGVDQTVAGGLHLGVEGVRDDDQPRPRAC